MPIGAGLGAVIGAGVNTIGGLIGQGGRSKKQHRRQKELMAIQFQNQQHLNTQGHNLSYEMWKKTNFPAQMKMLEEAGLNPALMYGMGGQGGTTQQSGGGSASGGQAHAPMDIGSIIQAQLAGAQRKLLEAQAKKAEAEAEKTSGVDTKEAETRIDKLIAETDHENIKKILTDYQSQTEKERIGLVYQQAIKAGEEVVEASRNNEIGDATKRDIIKGIGLDVIGKEIENDLKLANLNLKQTEIEALEHAIWQRWVNTGSLAIGSIGTIVNGFIKNGKLTEAGRKTVETVYTKQTNKGTESGHTIRKYN